jgi:hypothetical protein
VDGLTVRFLENEYYDIDQDAEVIKLMAITGKGTWCAETRAGKGSAAKRKEFQDYVLEQMYKGEQPCEVEFDG